MLYLLTCVALCNPCMGNTGIGVVEELIYPFQFSKAKAYLVTILGKQSMSCMFDFFLRAPACMLIRHCIIKSKRKNYMCKAGILRKSRVRKSNIFMGGLWGSCSFPHGYCDATTDWHTKYTSFKVYANIFLYILR